MRSKEGGNFKLNISNQMDGPQICVPGMENKSEREGRPACCMLAPLNYVYLAYVSGTDSAAPTERHWGRLH